MTNWTVTELTRDGSFFDYEKGLTETEAKELAKELNANPQYRGSEYYAHEEE